MLICNSCSKSINEGLLSFIHNWHLTKKEFTAATCLCSVIFCESMLCVHVHVFVMAVLLLYTLLPLGKVPAPIPATVTVGAPTAARVLLKQRSEDQSIGRSSASTGLATGSPTSPSEDTSVVGRGAGTAGGEDDHSDKGTYTIELENRNPEEEEARRMIDKVWVFRDLSNYLQHVQHCRLISVFLPQPSQ